MMESHVAARCQQCRVCLQIQPEDSGLGREDALGQSSKLDESFMILEATMGRDRAIQCWCFSLESLCTDQIPINFILFQTHTHIPLLQPVLCIYRSLS